MSKRPNKSASRATADEIRRVAVISDFDRVDPAPDQLCLLKRTVDAFDTLEVDDNAAWADAVEDIADIPNINNAAVSRMFQGGNMDRLRARYLVYGWELALIESTNESLEALLP